jgi:hypothetical protein
LQGCFVEDSGDFDNEIMQHGAHTYIFTTESVKGKGKGKKGAGKAKADKDDDDDDGPSYQKHDVSDVLDASDDAAAADDDGDDY